MFHQWMERCSSSETPASCSMNLIMMEKSSSIPFARAAVYICWAAAVAGMDTEISAASLRIRRKSLCWRERANCRGVIGHDGNDNIAVSGCFFGSPGNGSTFDGLRFLPGAIIDGKMIPGSYQSRGHVTTHMSHTDEANARFGMFLHGHDNSLLRWS